MVQDQTTAQGPHAGQPVLAAGEPLRRARAAMLMVHGRGATAEDILSLTERFDLRGFAYLAPQAAGNTWYPERFFAPLESNEPWLSSALATIKMTLAQIASTGLPPEQTILLGFSQGACLALEFAARHTQRYGGLAGLSGALIGPPGQPRPHHGSLQGTPIFLGCSDVDPHVAKGFVDAAAETLRQLGGAVTERLYPNMDHTINMDEIRAVREMMQGLLSTPNGQDYGPGR